MSDERSLAMVCRSFDGFMGKVTDSYQGSPVSGRGSAAPGRAIGLSIPGPARVLTTIEKTHRLKFAITGDACNAIYLNLATAGSILLLFMEKIGLNRTQMGVLMATLGFGPMIAPMTAQIGARLGFKRTALTFTVLRVFMLSGMLFAPSIGARYGAGAAFAYIAAVLGGFSLCRSTSDSQGGPWSMEFVPAGIRGKYTAIQTIVTMTCGAGSLLLVGWLLGTHAPLARFQWFFAAAIVFGLLPALAYSMVLGGAPQPGAKIGFGGILSPLKSRSYTRHLIGHMTVNFGWFATIPFVPLYMKDYVGLLPDQVVTLDAIGMLGSLCSSFLWGWAADRYGGKPVMVSLLSLHVVYPTGLLLIPHHSPWSQVFAASLIFFHGFIGIGWVIGFFRYFFINLVPQGSERTAYIALNTAMAGLMVGSGPLWAGWVLQRLSGLSGQFGPVTLTPHTPFFVFLIICVIVATWLMGGLPSAGALPTRQFASMLLQGNILSTVPGLVAFRLAGIEGKRIAVVGKLGSSRSPWGVEELIEALDDPSFGVRYEAVVSVTRTLRDPRLTDALIKVVRAADPGLQMAAVWALGRIGDARALPVLRPLLDSRYRTLRAQVARALGMLGDTDSGPRLLAMFGDEADPAVRAALGSALASLGQTDALPGLLALLHDLGKGEPADAVSSESRRLEVSLAVATLVGRDDQALRLWRRMHDQTRDTLGGTMLALLRPMARAHATDQPAKLNDTITTCAYAFAADDLPAGLGHLLSVLELVQARAFHETAWAVLIDAGQALRAYGVSRREYLLLAVHALHVGLRRDD